MGGAEASRASAAASVPDPRDAGDAEVADGGVPEVWDLVRRAQHGDSEAFGAFYDRYVGPVYRYLYFRLGDRAQAEDFTSETFLRALRRLDSLSFRGRDPGAWLMTIARNIVLDHVKSSRHRLEVVTDLAQQWPVADDRHAVDDPEREVVSRLDGQRLLRHVNSLGDEQRECIVLRFLHELSVSETAEVMGKNDGAIKALQYRALRRLASLLRHEPT